MSQQAITVHLPEHLYRRVYKRAQDLNHSLEDELAAVIEGLVNEDEWGHIPLDISEEVKQLSFLDNDHLWRTAQMEVSAERSDRMQELTEKQGSEGLTESEREEATQLQQLAHRIMLLRAEAAVLLKERGEDISPLSPDARNLP
ncbi:MAG: hypothetical protein KDE51_05590 [Anaerolineales bacterium]|nr:hypothetical protein [Anaerolineales bacterium]